MFKGFKKVFQDWVEKFNQNSDKLFILSFADLELVEINGSRRKCRLLSDELSKKIREIILPGGSSSQSIKFINFDLSHDELYDNDKYSKVFSNCEYCCAYNYWLEISKSEKKEISLDGTLNIGSCFMTSCPALHISDRDYDLYEKKSLQTALARTSAIQAIENTIKNGNIDQTTLKDAVFFLEESYVIARPIDCLHCNDEEELVPGREAEYYQTHINKCLWRPDRINDFKDSQIALIARIITNFNDYKKDLIQQVIEEAEEQGISEAELNNNRSGWQNTLFSLTNREAIWEYITDQLEADIKRLVDAKSKSAEERQQAEAEAKKKAKKEEERLKKEQKEREKKAAEAKKKREQQEAKKQAEEKKKAAERAKQQELAQKRGESITGITIALNQEFSLTNSDLSSQYQNWETQINQLTDIPKIINFQERILADIGARREEKKSAQEVKEDLNKAQTGTKEEKKQAWENLEKQETQKGYQDNQEEVEKLKKEKAAESPQQYSENAKRIIEEKLRNYGVKEEELSKENIQELQKLKNGEIQSPDQLVSVETKIKQNIYQQEAVKKMVL